MNMPASSSIALAASVPSDPMPKKIMPMALRFDDAE
jgi:hypothetical protein